MRISFDVTNTNLWKPFFSRSFSHPGLSSVQVSVFVEPLEAITFPAVCNSIILHIKVSSKFKTQRFCLSDHFFSARGVGVSPFRQNSRSGASGEVSSASGGRVCLRSDTLMA